MSSFSREELRFFTEPLCRPDRFETKLHNLEVVEESFRRRDECCAGLPVHLHVEASADCNLRCSICPRGRGMIERSGLLAFEKFASLFDMLSPTLGNIMISGWGEPLLNPETTRMIERATTAGVSVFMNSNGTLLPENVEKILESGLTVLCIALDGAMSRTTHAYDEQVCFEHVVRGIEQLRAAKDRGNYPYPRIHGIFIINEDTASEMQWLHAWASDLGIERVKFKRQMRTMPGQVERNRLGSVDELLENYGECFREVQRASDVFGHRLPPIHGSLCISTATAIWGSVVGTPTGSSTWVRWANTWRRSGTAIGCEWSDAGTQASRRPSGIPA